MVRMSPRLQKDVNAVEENELRRMEGLPPVSVAVGVGDRAVVGAAGGGVAAAEAFEADEAASRGGVLMAAATRDDGTKSAGVIVQGAAQRRDELASKMFANGGFRETKKIEPLLPHGGGGLKLAVPKRKEYGKEGDEGDAAHAAAMKQFSVKEFGSTHVQGKSIDARMRRVGLFGYWLEQNGYGKYVEWQMKSWKKKAKARVLVAYERDKTPRVPSEAAMMEYVLVMATGDTTSRPKGGWAEYHLGEHVKPGLHGKRKGEMMGEMKAFGTGPYADAPFRYRAIEQDVLAIRWFYDVLLEKLGGGALNPASTSTFKQLMKALSYLMGQRRIHVPKALTREIVDAICCTVDVESTEEMTAASMLVADFVWGGRAADLSLTDWSELIFELVQKYLQCQL